MDLYNQNRPTSCFTLQSVRRRLRQRAAVRLDQRAADGHQRAPSVGQRRFQRRHVVELDRGQAANEAFRSRLHHLLTEGLRPCVAGEETLTFPRSTAAVDVLRRHGSTYW